MQDMIFPFQFLGDPPFESALYKWLHLITEGAAGLGRPWTNVQFYKTWMKEIGFEDVLEKTFYWPLSPWVKGGYYKEISKYAQADFLGGLEGLSLKVMGSMGWSAERVQEFLVNVREDVINPEIHCYCSM